MAGLWSYATRGASGNVLFQGGPETLPTGWTFVGYATDPTLGNRQRSLSPITLDTAKAASRAAAPEVSDAPLGIIGVQSQPGVIVATSAPQNTQPIDGGITILTYYPIHT